MSRHGLLLILIIGLVGSIAVPMSHADYRRLFKAPADYIKKTQCPDVRERTKREYDLGYDKHHSPRVRAWYSDVMSISGADQAKQLQQISAVTNARIEYREERAEVWSTPGESISRGYGDCDDFVAAYLTAAVILGFKKDGLWFVVGYVNSRRGRIGHAIAIVALEDGSGHIFDNRARRVLPKGDYFLLDPVYGVNVGERAVWSGMLVDSEGKPRKAY